MPEDLKLPPVAVVPLTRGQELRDEFTCPITRSLMRVPVIAADGHTYDRAAIERWLAHHDNSPRTGEVLEHRLLVPNHNLKRLIDDLVREGGGGLYSAKEAERDARRTFDTVEETRAARARTPPTPGLGERVDRRASLVSEPVLLLQCLGPSESEWHGRTFEVGRAGCVGGRRRPATSGGGDEEPLEGRDFMPFADGTVSRRHFEISYAGEGFIVRDLGSASGTFRRLREGASAPLELGTMLMVGKHQLAVVACAPLGDAPSLALECFAPEGSPLQGRVFALDHRGATLGRRVTNAVAFSHEVDGAPVGVDSSVSAEHARVLWENGRFLLQDGAGPGRASTNGTWLRLSGLHRASEPADLRSGDELLVGTIRFHATATKTIVEREVPASVSTRDGDDDES